MTPTRLPSPLTVLVVDDHPLVRQGLRAIIETAVDAVDFLEAGSSSEAVELLDRQQPDVAIVDLGLPGGSGLDLVRRIHDMPHALPVLVLSMHPEEVYADRALRAGALGYVMKEAGSAVVLEALQKVLRKEIHLSGAAALRIAEAATGAGRSETSVVADFTDRELQIWKLVGEGMTTRGIAERLEISPKTVETHTYNIRQKTGIKNAHELVHEATRWVHGELS